MCGWVIMADQCLPAHPVMKPGWDAGFHVLDPYALNTETTRFYNTTRRLLNWIIKSEADPSNLSRYCIPKI